jgi:hypothetical protein
MVFNFSVIQFSGYEYVKPVMKNVFFHKDFNVLLLQLLL